MPNPLGRPKGSTEGVDGRALALRILKKYNEVELWERHLKSDDERIAFDALRHLTDRAYGKATENIHVSGLEGLADRIREGRQRAGTKFEAEDDRQS